MAADLIDDPFAPEKPYNGFDELPIGNYEILSFAFVRNQYYDPDDKRSPPRIIMIELSDQILFLPPYMALKLRDDDEKLKSLNEDGVKRYLCYGGRRAEGG